VSEKGKMVKGMETADKAAERERQKQARDFIKASYLCRKVSRQKSRATSSEDKRQNCSGGAPTVEQTFERTLSLPPKLTSRLCNIMLPSELKRSKN
jgi:hypothetical protein